MQDDEMIATSVTLPASLKARTERVAREQDRPMASVVRAALNKYLDDLEAESQPAPRGKAK